VDEADRVRRFLVDQRPVRGHWVHMGESWRALLQHADYPPAVRHLLGEAVAAAVLMAATLKFDGTLTFQLTGNGAVHLLVAQCTHDFRVRGVARFSPAAQSVTDFRGLVGDGNVAVTVETADQAARYQGIVSLEGDSLAAALEQYFDRSEQIPSRVILASGPDSIGGLLVQRIALQGGIEQPSDQARAQALWLQTSAAVSAMPNGALLTAPAESIARAAVPGEDVRLFGGSAVRFECRCSPERVAGLLRALGEGETRDVLREQGSVTVTCEFCQRPYSFDSIDVERLFASAQMAPGTDSLN
jgi:molecular chaperone Hsp33